MLCEGRRDADTLQKKDQHKSDYERQTERQERTEYIALTYGKRNESGSESESVMQRTDLATASKRS
jgi:hypothetical protein